MLGVFFKKSFLLIPFSFLLIGPLACSSAGFEASADEGPEADAGASAAGASAAGDAGEAGAPDPSAGGSASAGTGAGGSFPVAGSGPVAGGGSGEAGAPSGGSGGSAGTGGLPPAAGSGGSGEAGAPSGGSAGEPSGWPEPEDVGACDPDGPAGSAVAGYDVAWTVPPNSCVRWNDARAQKATCGECLREEGGVCAGGYANTAWSHDPVTGCELDRACGTVTVLPDEAERVVRLASGVAVEYAELDEDGACPLPCGTCESVYDRCLTECDTVRCCYVEAARATTCNGSAVCL